MNQFMLEVSLASILGCATAAVALFPNQRINVLLFSMHGERRNLPGSLPTLLEDNGSTKPI